MLVVYLHTDGGHGSLLNIDVGSKNGIKHEDKVNAWFKLILHMLQRLLYFN